MVARLKETREEKLQKQQLEQQQKRQDIEKSKNVLVQRIEKKKQAKIFKLGLDEQAKALKIRLDEIYAPKVQVLKTVKAIRKEVYTSSTGEKRKVSEVQKVAWFNKQKVEPIRGSSRTVEAFDLGIENNTKEVLREKIVYWKYDMNIDINLYNPSGFHKGSDFEGSLRKQSKDNLKSIHKLVKKRVTYAYGERKVTKNEDPLLPLESCQSRSTSNRPIAVLPQYNTIQYNTRRIRNTTSLQHFTKMYYDGSDFLYDVAVGAGILYHKTTIANSEGTSVRKKKRQKIKENIIK
ncbi:hypothetical protein L1987_87120 [Smallanthus sonchifolius]|nr:hypothetical protein L1987_87120 [Smallanthus sonchifolius]